MRELEGGRIPVSLIPVHTVVPGRARISVGGLKGCSSTAQLLERGLAERGFIRSASASELTGNVTVLFDPATKLDDVLEHIAAVLRGEVVSTPHADDHPEWHTMPGDQAAASLKTSPSAGLTDAEASCRLAAVGPNALRPQTQRSPAAILLAQFEGAPVAMLAGAAVLSIATGRLVEAAAIGAVLGLNGVIGFLTEMQTEATIRASSTSGPEQALVKRSASTKTIPASNLVPGDLLVLQRGSVVPADARVITAQYLAVSESGLTGESRPVAKITEALSKPDMPLADRANMAYRGTVVVGGSGTAVVVATGPKTEVGRVQRLVEASRPPETPARRQLRELGNQLVWVAAGAGLLLLATGYWRGLALLQLARSALSLAVASVPEGLPMIATTAHTVGVRTLREHDVLVRRLDAVETLASVNAVCFDKTGTLTENRMALTEIRCGDAVLPINNDGSAIASSTDAENASAGVRKLIEIACLCSEVEIGGHNGQATLDGSATETALIAPAARFGVDASRLRQDYPLIMKRQRSEADPLMVTIHDRQGQRFVAVKGNSAEILARCTHEFTPDGDCVLLAPERRAAIERANDEMASRALRVLGFAFRQMEANGEATDGIASSELAWVGLAGLSDPIRSGVGSVIERLHRAGVRTVMLTGDQYLTACAVADRIGLAGGEPLEIVDASKSNGLDTAALTTAAPRAHGFARITPGQKLSVVRALQSSGAVVAMIGDGINDSPALRGADVGVAMGAHGDAAAREVAEVFLRTDDLGRLALAIEQGRATQANVRKSLRFLLGTNGSEIALMLTAMAAGMGEALTPMQLLWINVITDVLPGIGLALEAPDPGIMQRPPQPADAALVGPAERQQLLIEAGTLTAGALAAGVYGAVRYGPASPQMQTLMFGSLVSSQLSHALTCRADDRVSGEQVRRPPNDALTAILGGSAIVQAAAFLLPPVRRVLGLAPLGLLDVAVLAGASALPLLANNLGKVIADRGPQQDTVLRFRRQLDPTAALGREHANGRLSA
jgi:P-type Ca2+ transporter type 2C